MNIQLSVELPTQFVDEKNQNYKLQQLYPFLNCLVSSAIFWLIVSESFGSIGYFLLLNFSVSSYLEEANRVQILIMQCQLGIAKNLNP